MKPAIIHDDNEIFVSFTPQEFSLELQKLIDDGMSAQEAIEKIVRDLKQKTLKA